MIRGIAFVGAMARPGRSPLEVVAVQAAFAVMPAELSGRAKADILSRRVVAELLRVYCEAKPVEIALARALVALEPDPVLCLAHNAEINLVADLHRERSDRFQARGCTQLSSAAWQSETTAIGEVLKARFADRFRRCTKLAAN